MLLFTRSRFWGSAVRTILLGRLVCRDSTGGPQSDSLASPSAHWQAAAAAPEAAAAAPEAAAALQAAAAVPKTAQGPRRGYRQSSKTLGWIPAPKQKHLTSRKLGKPLNTAAGHGVPVGERTRGP